MSVTNKIDKLPIEDEVRICPACSYDRGFHISFVRQITNNNSYTIVLICPECGARYDIKWIISLNKSV